MIASIIGNYLVEIGQLTREQLHDLLKEHRKVRVKLGVIAVSEGLMIQEEAERVNRLQAIMDMHFGDIAIEERYLTEGQVESLLKKQDSAYLAFAQALENQQLMKVDQLEQLLIDFQYDNNFTASDMEALKSGDINRIITLYLPLGEGRYERIAGTAFRTIMRLVDQDICPSKGILATEWETQKGAFQRVNSARGFTCGLVGKKDALAPLACSFGQEHFMTVDEDALDAVGEVINCINGLVATGLSDSGDDFELCPPEYYLELTRLQGEEIMVIPLCVLGEKIELVISLDSKIQMI